MSSEYLGKVTTEYLGTAITEYLGWGGHGVLRREEPSTYDGDVYTEHL